MSAASDSRLVESPGRDRSRVRFQAGRAAAQLSWSAALLGALGLAACAFVLLRLLETWRVTPHGVSHHISLLGQRLGYPSANAAAIVVLALAIVGLVVLARVLTGVARELRASRRFTAALAARGVRPMADAFLVEDDNPAAFCAGLLRPRAYVTSGAVAVLDEAALEAVLRHERHHAVRRDPLRLAVARVLGSAMFFLPGIGELGRRHRTLAEMSADEGAISAAPGNRAALARAMLTFSEAAQSGDGSGVDPERVDNLLGSPPNWSFPALLVAAGAGTLALLITIGVLVGSVASGSASLAVPFLSAQPCVVVLATIPAALVLAGMWRTMSRREDSNTPGV